MLVQRGAGGGAAAECCGASRVDAGSNWCAFMPGRSAADKRSTHDMGLGLHWRTARLQPPSLLLQPAHVAQACLQLRTGPGSACGS